MLARVHAAAIIGIEAVPVTVEVDVSPGLPGLTVVGLPDATVRESRDRVRTAIRNSGFPFPPDRITVSLAPSDLRKMGSAFDLPMALGILAASGVLPARDEVAMTIIGDLSLDGSVAPMRGLLPIAVAARLAGRSLLFPGANTHEAALVEGLRLFPVTSLLQAAQVFVAPDPTPQVPERPPTAPAPGTLDDLSDVRGQVAARRALEIAAAGGHHILLCGPPGAGKTMLARRLPGILPPLSIDEALEVTSIHSVAGQLPPGEGLVMARPFRAPHHTCSDVALMGGGAQPRPGEISLAHRGVLFLDELPEFGRRVLETLRQPVESGAVHVVRAQRAVRFPADVMLVAAMNPCPCGYWQTGSRACRCSPAAVHQYRQRLSGPLRDRFDLTLDVPALTWSELTAGTVETSAMVRGRVLEARRRQIARQRCLNSRLTGPALGSTCRATDDLLRSAVERFALSARAVARIGRVARSIADLEGASEVTRGHVAEALQFRSADSDR